MKLMPLSMLFRNCALTCTAQSLWSTQIISLCYAYSPKAWLTKIQRWAILLAEYGATIKYRPGNNNIRADMLSRLPPESVGVIDASQDYTNPPRGPADIADDPLPFIIDGLDRQALSQAQKVGFPNLWGKAGVEDSGYIIHKDVLYSIWTPSTNSPEYPRIVLQPQFQEAVIDRAHHEVDHMATQKTLSRLREAYVWPHMRESIRSRLNKCATCAVHYRKQAHVAMGDMPLPVSPMQIVALDLIGPFVASCNDNKYILNIIALAGQKRTPFQISVARL